MKLNEALTSWYQKNQRDLPFRKNKNPYAIWVSEIMAQQTRIDSMIPYFHRWMEKWPTIEALANADIEDILHCWQGLGYYNRARKLHEGAKKVKEVYQGQLPADIDLLQEIPGIGFYTAGAIGSIAFGLRAPAVDGNVLRVTTRQLEIKEDITKKTTVDQVYQIVYEWMDGADTSDFTQGLMEIGALICTPKNPGCLLCPLRDFCKCYSSGTQLQYPVKKAAKKPLEMELNTYFITNHRQEVLLSQDWSDGLMEGLYRLPQYDTRIDKLKEAVFVTKRKHVFSHRVWNMTCFQMEVEDIVLEQTQWVKLSELKKVSLVTAHRKWLNELVEELKNEN